MLGVVVLSVIMLSVVAPFKQRRSINADYVTFVFDGQGYNGQHISIVILNHRHCRYTITNKLRVSIYTSMTPFSETQTLSACASAF